MFAAGGYILGWILDQPRSHLGPNNTRYVSEYSYTAPPPLPSPVVTYVYRINFTHRFHSKHKFQNIDLFTYADRQKHVFLAAYFHVSVNAVTFELIFPSVTFEPLPLGNSLQSFQHPGKV